MVSKMALHKGKGALDPHRREDLTHPKGAIRRAAMIMERGYQVEPCERCRLGGNTCIIDTEGASCAACVRQSIDCFRTERGQKQAISKSSSQLSAPDRTCSPPTPRFQTALSSPAQHPASSPSPAQHNVTQNRIARGLIQTSLRGSFRDRSPAARHPLVAPTEARVSPELENDLTDPIPAPKTATATTMASSAQDTIPSDTIEAEVTSPASMFDDVDWDMDDFAAEILNSSRPDNRNTSKSIRAVPANSDPIRSTASVRDSSPKSQSTRHPCSELVSETTPTQRPIGSFGSTVLTLSSSALPNTTSPQTSRTVYQTRHLSPPSFQRINPELLPRSQARSSQRSQPRSSQYSSQRSSQRSHRSRRKPPSTTVPLSAPAPTSTSSSTISSTNPSASSRSALKRKVADLELENERLRESYGALREECEGRVARLCRFGDALGDLVSGGFWEFRWWDPAWKRRG